MADDFIKLREMTYSGRSFIGFRTTRGTGFSYEFTGRSPPSQARQFVFDEKSKVMRTELIEDDETLVKMFDIKDEKALAELKTKIASGNPKLTVYDAMRLVDLGDERRLVVSNGAQTKLLYNSALFSRKNSSPIHILEDALEKPFLEYDEKTGIDIDLTSYEPDPPIFTTRVNGCISRHNFAYYVVRKDPMSIQGKPEVISDQIKLMMDQGFLVATYKGGNEKPVVLPFERIFDIKLRSSTAEGITRDIYDVITRPNPADNNKVYGVGVCTMILNDDGTLDVAKLNRSDVVMGRVKLGE